MAFTASSEITLMTTELNSLASNARAIASSGYNNATNQWLRARFFCKVTFAVAPTSGNRMQFWLACSPDGGTNYEDAVTGADPGPELYVGDFVVRDITTIQIIPIQTRLMDLPPLFFKPFIKNGSGQAFPGSGSVITARFWKW